MDDYFVYGIVPIIVVKAIVIIAPNALLSFMRRIPLFVVQVTAIVATAIISRQSCL